MAESANTEPQFQILIENDAQFLAAIQRAKGVMEDLTTPLRQIGLMLFKSEKAIFSLKGPGQYEDLSEEYKKIKQRRWGQVYPILKASGRLESSVTDPASPDAVMEISNKDTLFWGTKVPYGVYHQSLAPRTKIPWRPFLIWGADSRFAPDLASSRHGRALNILNAYALRALGQQVAAQEDAA